MVTYKRDEIISASEVARGFSNILNSIINRTKDKLAISKNNKIEADIEEYERLQRVYDMFEQHEIEQMLNQRTKEDKEVSHSKTITIEI